jgi:hypothetical protein
MMPGDGGSRQRIAMSQAGRWRGVLVCLAIAFGLFWTAQVVLAVQDWRFDQRAVRA